jgi:hypothetical protein
MAAPGEYLGQPSTQESAGSCNKSLHSIQRLIKPWMERVISAASNLPRIKISFDAGFTALSSIVHIMV